MAETCGGSTYGNLVVGGQSEGVQLPDSVNSTSNLVNLIFATSESSTMSGWNLTWSEISSISISIGKVPLAILDLKALPQRKLWLAEVPLQLVRAWRSSLCQPPTTAQSLICLTVVDVRQCPSCPEDDWWSVVVMTGVLTLPLTPASHGLQATRAGHTFKL